MFKDMTREQFPDIRFSHDLAKICNLENPETRYPNAREIKRRIIYHSGPTNSGKTYHALQALMDSPTGVYCGPLRLLASEIFTRLNSNNVPCDLVTGEERRYGISTSIPSPHLSCTIEMSSTNTQYEVAIIDEIQMIKDSSRGWAWTNALLGLCATELHLCGDASAVELVRCIANNCGDTFEVRNYERLSSLKIEEIPINMKNLETGDCLVAFDKKTLIRAAKYLSQYSSLGFSIIYGSLPPDVKLEQARKFNDVHDNSKILLATDAIGMGLNLNIKRIIFKTVYKYSNTSLSISEVKQISGRAGRFSSEFQKGTVTALDMHSLKIVKDLMNQSLPSTMEAVLALTADIVESLSFYLPYANLLEIMRVFDAYVSHNNLLYTLSSSDSCVRRLALLINDVALDPRVAYRLCCAPVPGNELSDSLFREIALCISQQRAMSYYAFAKLVNYPPSKLTPLDRISELEIMNDCVDIYTWLSYRFPMNMPEAEEVRKMYPEINKIINSALGMLTSSKSK